MQFAPTGRLVFYAQWALAVFLPLFVFVGRGFVGAGLGWMSVLGIVLYGPILTVLLLVPPAAALFDTQARRAGSTREAYTIASAVVWLALLVAGLTIPDAGDGGSLDTALMTWFGVSETASVLTFSIAVGVALVAWIATLVVTGRGIRLSRAAR